MSKKLRICFFGSPLFAVSSLDKLREAEHEILCVITQPPKPANRGKKIYTDLYGDPVGQKIYEVGGAELANAFGNAYTNNFPNILLNMESIPASEYKNEYEIFYRQPDLAVMDLLFNIGLNYHRRKYQINNG